MKMIFILLAGLPLLISCSSLDKLVESPKVDVTDVRLASAKGEIAILEIVLDVKNPNGIAVTVDSLEYDLNVNEKTVTTGTYDKKVKIEANQTTTVAIPISVNYKDLLKTALSILVTKGAPYRAKGKVGIGPFSIPFDEKGMIKFKDL